MKTARIPLTVLATLSLGSSLATAQTYETPRRDVPVREYQDRNGPVVERDVRTREMQPRVLASTDVASVERRRNEVLNRDTLGRKLSAAEYQELNRQRYEVDGLIARMRAGQQVSSESVDRALGIY
jgi:hypothetical protein